MKKEIQSLVNHIEETFGGQPWFGRAAFELLDEIDPSIVHIKPGNKEHSLSELLYHMITWMTFTEKRILGEKDDMKAFEKLDWREMDASAQNWTDGLGELKRIKDRIISLLKEKEDSFLDEKVDFREYNFRFLITGMIEHSIYHLGQIAYVKKLLS